MKKRYLIGLLIELVVMSIIYYMALPAMNVHSSGFWAFTIFALLLWGFIWTFIRLSLNLETCFVKNGRNYTFRKTSKGNKSFIPFLLVIVIVVGILIVNLFCSPFFNAKSYSRRIVVDETGDFIKDIKEVDFNSLPLLDRDSSEKLGDRVMGQMSDFVSQYYVSNQYTQINYKNDIVRVTPLEYADFIKWIFNRGEGVKGYIKVNSVNGNTELVKLEKGMKYMPSAYFNDNLYRKLRFKYPTKIFGDAKFEIDNEGKPYWIVPTYGYIGVECKTKVTGVVIMDPVTGESKLYKMDKVPSWVDNAYNAELLIEQINNWGTYRDGFLNSIFGQKNVVNTTTGYNYLAMDDDVYLYTGITSVLSDESNLGFILSNMRTGKTVFYSVPGAEEYSAMASAEGQVQQMSYVSTFPLLINLNNKPTYLVSLKDAAGLVKMYGFIDVADYQKVVVTDASSGIIKASQNYLNKYADEISESLLVTKTIKVKRISNAIINGNTYYYITDSDDHRYKLSIELSDTLAFVSVNDEINIGYYETDSSIIDVVKVIK